MWSSRTFAQFCFFSLIHRKAIPMNPWYLVSLRKIRHQMDFTVLCGVRGRGGRGGGGHSDRRCKSRSQWSTSFGCPFGDLYAAEKSEIWVIVWQIYDVPSTLVQSTGGKGWLFLCFYFIDNNTTTITTTTATTTAAATTTTTEATRTTTMPNYNSSGNSKGPSTNTTATTTFQWQATRHWFRMTPHLLCTPFVLLKDHAYLRTICSVCLKSAPGS